MSQTIEKEIPTPALISLEKKLELEWNDISTAINAAADIAEAHAWNGTARRLRNLVHEVEQ